MRHVDIIPDWVIAVLVVLVVAGVFRLFGGLGVLVLGIIATAVWIAQIIECTSSVRDRDRGTGSPSAPALRRHPGRAEDHRASP